MASQLLEPMLVNLTSACLKLNLTMPQRRSDCMQFDGGNASLVKTEISDFFGTEDIAVADIEEDENQALNYRVYLDFDMNGADFPTFDGHRDASDCFGKTIRSY